MTAAIHQTAVSGAPVWVWGVIVGTLIALVGLVGMVKRDRRP